MVNKETIEEYENLLDMIDDALSQNNPLRSSISLFSMLDEPLIRELTRLTGHSGTYFISSEPDGIRLDFAKLVQVYNRISHEIEFDRG